MSVGYDGYLEEHVSNVIKAAEWIVDNLRPELDMSGDEVTDLLHNVREHDGSKYDEAEYDAYDGYFYLGVHDDDAFNRAWLHHIHHNPHHWQHWLLVNDDGKYRDPCKVVPIEIPKEYVVEMVADWWSFSWRSGNLGEIFDWYDAHKDKIILHDRTRTFLEHVLGAIRTTLDECDGSYVDAERNVLRG